MESRDLLLRMMAYEPITLKVVGNDFLRCGLSLRCAGSDDVDRSNGYF